MQDDIALITTLKLRILQEPSKKQAQKSLKRVRRNFAGVAGELLIPPIFKSFFAEWGSTPSQ